MEAFLTKAHDPEWLWGVVAVGVVLSIIGNFLTALIRTIVKSGFRATFQRIKLFSKRTREKLDEIEAACLEKPEIQPLLLIQARIDELKSLAIFMIGISSLVPVIFGVIKPSIVTAAFALTMLFVLFYSIRMGWRAMRVHYIVNKINRLDRFF